MRLERKDTWVDIPSSLDATYGYKGFGPGLICRDKQYVVGEIFEEPGASACCKPGVMHYCKHPYDVLEWYPPYVINGGISEYALVKPLGDIHCGPCKYATNKLEIVKKLSLREMLEIGSTIPRTIFRPIKFSFEDGRHNELDGLDGSIVVIGGCGASVCCEPGINGALYYFGNDGYAELKRTLTGIFLIGKRISLHLEGTCNTVYVVGQDCSIEIDGNTNRVMLDNHHVNPKIKILKGYYNDVIRMF